MVKASLCGSEERGFESPQSPFMSRKVYIWVRTNFDWLKMDEDKLFAHNLIKFHHREFTQIAKRALQQVVDNGSVSGILYDLDMVHALDDNDLIVPIDDDDFFHPFIGDRLRIYDESCEFFLWDLVRFCDLDMIGWGGGSRLGNHPLHKGVQPVKTNNSAISARLLKKV